ncbi:MAG TPA: hypothetical protein VFA52_03280 [Candidatus Paceibacterota bacterium]|nr:hypothetical protein [Candidatus Paceibacterota bacterium]
MNFKDFAQGIPDPVEAELLFFSLPQTSHLDQKSLLLTQDVSKIPQEEVYFRTWASLLFLLPLAGGRMDYKSNSPRTTAEKEWGKSWRFKIGLPESESRMRAEFHKGNIAFLYQKGGIQKGTWVEIYKEVLKLPQRDHISVGFFFFNQPKAEM